MSTYDNSGYHKAKQAEKLRNVRHAQRQTQSAFDKSRLPAPAAYYEAQGLRLTGKGAWRDAICPFHEDTKPSLRVRTDNGAFCCMVCGTKGGDVLAFHQQRHGLTFKAAAVALGAWKGATQ